MKEMNQAEQYAYLRKLVRMEMPFGKYKGRLLIDLPDHYLAWFAREGFPKGQLGDMLTIIHETRLNGGGEIFRELRKHA